ncbi:hypothetical protein QUC31_018230 [Theobroma cacao]
MARRYCYNEVLPFTAMAAVECSNVVQNILFKAASSKGMSYYIFIAYAYILATLALLPLICLLFRKGLPKFEFPLISRLCFLGLVGFAGQLCAYKGLELGSPTLSSAIGNLTPAFTFILAVFFRMEKVALRSSSTRAKIIGTIASMSGASVVVLYKGPEVQQPLGSSQSKWVFSGLLLAASYLLSSFWYIIQSQIMKIYPEEMIVTFIYNLSLAILSVPVCFLAESNMTSWRPTRSIVAASILYSGLFSLNFSCGVHSWGVRLKGPVYVAIFKPLSIVIAAIMSAFFLGDALYLGSVIGALILSAGLYAVLWGKAQGEEMTHYDSGSSSFGPLSSCKVPLLQSHNDAEM